jgi:MFS transporter, ACS family, tartrate transporter
MVAPTVVGVSSLAPSVPSDTDLARATMRRVSARLLPFLAVLYLCNTVDRTNIAMAEHQLSRDLGLSASAYSLGAGIFFIG